MKNAAAIQVTEKIIKFTQDMHGVFGTSDLHYLIGMPTFVANQRAIDDLIRSGILQRVKRGVYVTKKFDPFVLSARLNPKSYISMDTVLIRNGLVGTLNPRQISCVTEKPRAQSYTIEKTRVVFHSVDASIYSGFTRMEHGILWADNEKAFLDLLYFYLRGEKFPFDPKNEVRIDKLDVKKLKLYLEKYNNPKFRSFAERFFI